MVAVLGADEHRRHLVSELRARFRRGDELVVDVEAHSRAVVRGAELVPLVGSDGGGGEQIPGLHLPMEKWAHLRVEAQPVLAAKARVVLADQHRARTAATRRRAIRLPIGLLLLLLLRRCRLRRQELHGESEGRGAAEREHRRRSRNVQVCRLRLREERPHAASARVDMYCPRKRLAAARKPAAPSIEQRCALQQEGPMKLLLADEAHIVAHRRRQVSTLIHAPVADQIFAQRLRVQRVRRGERFDLRGIE
mmetsp:Transcript_2851/g.5936  ORF Transcript_2851/g.5936 Transcript_2851/m.5936 type:complete len:251 (-) Transcript_2851:662-1414(-)